MSRLLKELLIPFVILLFTLLYWLSIRGAPNVSTRVPMVAIAVIAIFMVLTLFRIYTEVKGEIKKENKSDSRGFDGIMAWFGFHKSQLLLIAFSYIYYLIFEIVGFNVANVLFMLAILPAIGYWQGRSVKSAIMGTFLITFLTTIVLYLLARVMDFNVPSGLIKLL